MLELFCPIHGIPAIVGALVGLDGNTLILTAQIYYARLTSFGGKVWQSL